MTDKERKLLDTLLDCLDRLYDGDVNSIEVQDLLSTTAIALSRTEHFELLRKTQKRLDDAIASHETVELPTQAALVVTDELRNYLSGMH